MKMKLLYCLFLLTFCLSCKTARPNSSYGKQVVTAAADQNTDPVANGMAQFFAELYAKNGGDIAKTVKQLEASGQEGEAVKKQLLDYLSTVQQINDEHKLKKLEKSSDLSRIFLPTPNSKRMQI
jgi:ribosomal protein S11